MGNVWTKQVWWSDAPREPSIREQQEEAKRKREAERNRKTILWLKPNPRGDRWQITFTAEQLAAFEAHVDALNLKGDREEQEDIAWQFALGHVHRTQEDLLPGIQAHIEATMAYLVDWHKQRRSI